MDIQNLFAEKPKIKNITLNIADKKYPVEVTSNTRKYVFQCRDNVDLKIFEDENATEYFTLKAGGVIWDDYIYIRQDEKIFFVSCSEANVVCELIFWTGEV